METVFLFAGDFIEREKRLGLEEKLFDGSGVKKLHDFIVGDLDIQEPLKFQQEFHAAQGIESQVELEVVA